MVWFGLEPSYSEDAAGSLETGGNRPLDIKYQLIKLYADRYVHVGPTGLHPAYISNYIL